jgi:predicted Zn-dependent protease
LAIGLCVALLAASWFASSQPAAGKAERDRASLLAMLDGGDYARLDAYLLELQAGYERGDIAEARLETAFDAFASADPDLEPRLASWIERSSNATAARLARAAYYLHLGRIELGNRPQGRAPARVREPGRDYLSLARQDGQAAVAQQPPLGLAYALLIGIAMAENAAGEADRLFELGREADPRSAALWRSFLLSLRPWRRPNENPDDLMATLDRLVQDLRESSQDRTELAALSGFHAFLTAELLRRQRRHGQAGRHYRDALAKGGDWVYLRGADINALQSGRAVAAVRYFSQALARHPQDPGLLDWQSRALMSLGNHEAALANWVLALSLDPGNPRILLGYAQALRELGRGEAAAEMLADAAPIARDNARIRALYGEILLTDLAQPRAAIAELRTAIELDPDVGEGWRAYAEALLQMKDCTGAATAIGTYQRICANGVRCSESDLRWAEDARLSTQDPDICPADGILGP